MSLRVSAGTYLTAIALIVATGPSAALDLQGHRGARGLLPENTLPAFERAIELGVDTLELDTGVSKDGIVVVTHDRRLSHDLTRGPDGAWVDAPGPLIKDLTADAIARYDVGRIKPGSRTAQRFPDQEPRDGTPVPRLSDVLALGTAHPALRFNIETKLSPVHPGDTVDPETFAGAVIATVRAAGIAADRVAIQSFDWRTLAAVNRQAPDIATICLTAEQRWLNNIQRGQSGASPWTAGHDIDDHGSVPKLVKAAGCATWSPYHRDLTPAALAEAHDLGLKVVVWTVNQPDAMRHLQQMGVDGIITDYPDRAREALGRM